MDRIKLYIDEDAVRKDLASALRTELTVLTAAEAGLSGATDERHLGFATGRGYVLYSYNTGDYCRLHSEWLQTGRDHAGIIVAPQQHFSIGEQLRRILRIAPASPPLKCGTVSNSSPTGDNPAPTREWC